MGMGGTPRARLSSRFHRDDADPPILDVAQKHPRYSGQHVVACNDGWDPNWCQKVS